MPQLLAWWRGVRQTSPSSPGIHVAPSVLPHRHSGQTKAPPDMVRQLKKELQAWNKNGSLSGHIQFNFLPAAQLIQQHTFPSLTQSQPETHHSSLSSPLPRHMTMHMHSPRAFNIQSSNIYDLKLTSQTLYNFNNVQAPTTCILHSLLQYFHHRVHVP